MELETRLCATCGEMSFRCLPTSKQRSCSKACETLGLSWGELGMKAKEYFHRNATAMYRRKKKP